MSKWKRVEKYPDGVPITPRVTRVETSYSVECEVCGTVGSSHHQDTAIMWRRDHEERFREKHVEALRKEGSLG